MSSSFKKPIILTSRLNFQWTSMEEIIPFIENTWTDFYNNKSISVEIINVDHIDLRKDLPRLLKADLFIVTCFNLNIVNYIKLIRSKLNISSPLVFYVHGLATIAYWPIQRFGFFDLLDSHDLFIGTCEGDRKSHFLSIENLPFEKHAFSIFDSIPKIEKFGNNSPFVFIGRISPQKNLIETINAYAKLPKTIKEKHKLIFFGKEDHYGYPNLGIEEKAYLEKCQKLVNDLDLNEYIFFKGFQSRENIQDELKNGFIFVSASTHSDENFGMALFRSLLMGAPAVISPWGGHLEFKDYFDKQLYYFQFNPTDQSFIDHMSIAMLKAASDLVKHDKDLNKVHNPFDLNYYNDQFNKIENILKTNAKNPKVAPIFSNLSKIIQQQQKEFEKLGRTQQCFTGFDDINYKKLFQAYLR